MASSKMGASGLEVNALSLQDMVPEPEAIAKPRIRRSRWVLLLLLPYLGLCFPGVYARSTPELWGFPFFYWYQFAWVILASGLLAIVYRKLKT
jgi:peptidoglycan/LPS O-acetylase OafA/YrhL